MADFICILLWYLGQLKRVVVITPAEDLISDAEVEEIKQNAKLIFPDDRIVILPGGPIGIVMFYTKIYK